MNVSLHRNGEAVVFFRNGESKDSHLFHRFDPGFGVLVRVLDLVDGRLHITVDKGPDGVHQHLFVVIEGVGHKYIIYVGDEVLAVGIDRHRPLDVDVIGRILCGMYSRSLVARLSTTREESR